MLPLSSSASLIRKTGSSFATIRYYGYPTSIAVAMTAHGFAWKREKPFTLADVTAVSVPNQDSVLISLK